MKLEKIVVAAIVVVALAVSGVVAFWPSTASSAYPTGGPTPIAGPVTPTGYPYSSLAILRAPRLSTDVLTISDPADDVFQKDTARHLLTTKSADVWLVVDAKGDPCLYNVGSGTTSSDCLTTKPSERTLAPGAVVLGAGFPGGKDGVTVDVVADGTPVAGAIDEGFRQIASNIWVKGAGITVDKRPVVKNDPFSFPVGQPYASLAILRRPATAADALPAAWYSGDSTSGPGSGVILSSVRLSTTVGKDRVWVGAATDGSACLIAESQDAGLLTACGTLADGDRTGVVGAGLGDGGDEGNVELVPDGVSAQGQGTDAELGGLNVIVTPATKK